MSKNNFAINSLVPPIRVEIYTVFDIVISVIFFLLPEAKILLTKSVMEFVCA